MPEINVLFRSFKANGLVLPNRIVMAPMTRGKSPGGVPAERVARYYERRALGGVGLIITEGTILSHPSADGYPDVPMIADGKPREGWMRVVDRVHAAGGKIALQLWHVGSYCRPGYDRGRRILRWAPSAVTHPGLLKQEIELVPERMSSDQIEAIVASYAESAALAKSIGFDAIEIHGAHGYLIDQFFWSATNKRLDEYGGSLRQRTKFAQEIVHAVRRAVGDNYPIIFRFSNWKLNVYDQVGKLFNTANELSEFLAPLSKAGVDIFHASTRHFDNPEFEGSSLNLAGWTKKLSGKPVITVGSVGLSADFISERQGTKVSSASLNRLLERMENDEFDLVAVGRALLADPQWVYKVRHHMWDEINVYDKSCLERLR